MADPQIVLSALNKSTIVVPKARHSLCYSELKASETHNQRHLVRWQYSQISSLHLWHKTPETNHRRDISEPSASPPTDHQNPIDVFEGSLWLFVVQHSAGTDACARTKMASYFVWWLFHLKCQSNTRIMAVGRSQRGACHRLFEASEEVFRGQEQKEYWWQMTSEAQMLSIVNVNSDNQIVFYKMAIWGKSFITDIFIKYLHIDIVKIL